MYRLQKTFVRDKYQPSLCKAPSGYEHWVFKTRSVLQISRQKTQGTGLKWRRGTQDLAKVSLKDSNRVPERLLKLGGKTEVEEVLGSHPFNVTRHKYSLDASLIGEIGIKVGQDPGNNGQRPN